jgi:hypothetical protein
VIPFIFNFDRLRHCPRKWHRHAQSRRWQDAPPRVAENLCYLQSNVPFELRKLKAFQEAPNRKSYGTAHRARISFWEKKKGKNKRNSKTFNLGIPET